MPIPASPGGGDFCYNGFALLEVVEAQSLQKEHTMIMLVLLAVFGLVSICWAMFNLAVYAVPFWIGLASGVYLYDSGQGLLVSLAAGLFLGTATVVVGEIVFVSIRSTLIRGLFGLLYAVPAGVAGFHAAKGLSDLGGAGETTATVLSWIGAALVGVTAWVRIVGWFEGRALEPQSRSGV